MTEDVIKLPSEKVLRGLIAKAKTTADKTSTLNGAYGEAVAYAVEEHNLHAQAFKLCVRLERMDAVKLMSFLSHFDAYRDTLKLDNLAAPDFPGMNDDEDEKPPIADKVVPINTKAAQAAEQAVGAAALDAMAPETKKSQSATAADKRDAVGIH